jgi:hypothetical protein
MRSIMLRVFPLWPGSQMQSSLLVKEPMVGCESWKKGKEYRWEWGEALQFCTPKKRFFFFFLFFFLCFLFVCELALFVGVHATCNMQREAGAKGA